MNDMLRPIERLLPLLDKVKTGEKPHTWTACCPAHEDKSPSMSIKETDDFMVLVRCHTGCSFNEIASAVGLKPEEFFPDKPKTHHAPPNQKPFSPVQTLRVIYSDLQRIAITAHDIVAGTQLNEDDYHEFSLAIERVEDAILKSERVK